MKNNRKIYLRALLIALALTLLTAFSATAFMRRIAEFALQLVTDEALLEILQPLRFIRFRISLLPAAIGTAVVSLPVYRIFRTQKTASRIGWTVLILLLLGILWIISLFTLRIGLASFVKIIPALLSLL